MKKTHQEDHPLIHALKANLRPIQQNWQLFGLGRWEDIPLKHMVWIYPTVLIGQVFRELVKDRGLVRASSLAFTTVMSVVPMLTVATTLLGAFGSSTSALIRILEGVLPVSKEEITNHLLTFTQRQGGTLSGIGSVVLLVLGIAMFNNIEHAFNDIWRVTRRRPFFKKALTFYALITLAPLMITISVVQTARVQLFLDEIPVLASVGYQLLPLGLGFVAFTLGNKLLPYTKVKMIPALVSGFVTAFAFEVAKRGFNFYVETIVGANYSAVYGAIGLIPVFLVWIYISWVVVLFGAEMSYTIQHLRHILLPERLHNEQSTAAARYNPLIALDVMAPIAETFQKAQGPIDIDQIAARAAIPPTIAEEVVERLVSSGAVLELGATDENQASRYFPAIPLKDIKLKALLDACRADGREPAPLPTLRALYELHQEHEEEIFDKMGADTLVDLDAPERLKMFARSLALPLAAEEEPLPIKALKKTSQEVATSLSQMLARGSANLTQEKPTLSPIDALAALGPPPQSQDQSPEESPKNNKSAPETDAP